MVDPPRGWYGSPPKALARRARLRYTRGEAGRKEPHRLATQEDAAVNLPLELEVAELIAAKPTRGEPLEVRLLRPLTEDDLARAIAEREVEQSPLRRISERHHALARAFAEGKTTHEAAATAGYTSARARLLRTDPAFQELVALYKEKVELEYINMHRRMAALGAEAVEELHDRLEDDPDGFTTNQLLEIMTRTADRTGFGPSSSQMNVNVNVDLAEKLKLARERARPRIIDAEVLPPEEAA